ncbi:MAG: ABC transporter ATP-binding protein [Alphaproteobacteria bacterium]
MTAAARTAPEDAPALAVERLGYSFGKSFALDDVSFAIRAGEFKVLLGPNGAGKTTLFSLITRLYDARTGRVRIAGHDLRRASTRALCHIGVVFQQPTLDLDLTVRQNLRYHAALHGLARAETETRIAVELERLDMAERAGERVRQLNGGHRRRVEIARALLHRPGLLLLDEPTVGLDVPTRQAIVDHVHALCASGAIAVLWATHLIDEVRPGDHVIVLHRGRVQAQGALDAVNAAAGAATIAEAFDALTRG